MRTLEKIEITFTKTASDKLISLRPVFEKLRLVHQQYINDSANSDKEDFPYWYSERPQVGFLAAAVWKSGGVALEEYGTIKALGRGRGDLWIIIDGSKFECEAKRLWLRFNRKKSPENLKDEILNDEKNGLEEAVKNINDHTTKRGLALCFVTPAIKNKIFDEDDHRKLLKETINLLKGKVDAIVWIGFQDWKKAKLGTDVTYYPGLLMVIKEVVH